MSCRGPYHPVPNNGHRYYAHDVTQDGRVPLDPITASLKRLYAGTQCSKCGMRFPSFSALSDHYNTHMAEMAAIKQKGARVQRQWFLPMDDWVRTCGGTSAPRLVSAPAAAGVPPASGVAADSASARSRMIPALESDTGTNCAACHDTMDGLVYVDETDEWFFSDAVRDADGLLYHGVCYQPPTPNPKKRGAAADDGDLALASTVTKKSRFD